MQNGQEKKEEVRTMFNQIAKQYDLLNHVLSFGIDFYWRRRTIQVLKSYAPNVTLDVATGTADLAILAAKKKATNSVVGIDISSGMLALGVEKVKKNNLTSCITLQLADSENLPFDDMSFDAAMVAYGVRNFGNLAKGITEIRRCLKPGTPLLVLEFSTPENPIMRNLYKFYSFNILPLIGRIVSRSSNAYTYLPESVSKFPSGKDFEKVMLDCGFKNTQIKPMSFGITTLYIGIA